MDIYNVNIRNVMFHLELLSKNGRTNADVLKQLFPVTETLQITKDKILESQSKGHCEDQK